MVVERGGWWSYRDDDGVIIPSKVIKEEDEVLLWGIVKQDPSVGSEWVG